MDLGDDVGAIDDERTPPWHTEGHMQRRAVFRDVDVLPAEHRVPALFHTALPGELAEQAHRLVGDAVLGVVEIQAGPLRAQPLTTVRVLSEQLTQMDRSDLGVMLFKRLPRRLLPQGVDGHLTDLLSPEPPARAPLERHAQG